MSALEYVGARKAYGDVVALDDLSLTVKAGEIHAIVGLNGAGKTTAMKAAVGHTRLDGGAVRVLGSEPDRAEAAVWGALGFVVDQAFGYPELSVRANLVAAARLHGMSRPAAQEAATRWIDRLELGRWRERRARGLSLGNRQRLGLACAIAHDPDLVILDEPTNALDPAGVLVLRDILVAAADRGAAVLVSSHHLDEVARIAHRISVVHAGRVVGSLAPGQTDLERHFFETVRDWDARHRVAERT